ncbi:SRPBCC family protein [Micromonospora sp. NPDC023814]|uniref:SRPBCC family protein n=1 Tax=Micromonospora sp. NPDC023814 TaxID=3154596 RepID=UPI0033C9424B
MTQEKTAPAAKSTTTKSTAAKKPKPPNYDPFVRHSVTVKADRKTAFTMFLEGFPEWWPNNFRTTKVGAPLGVDKKGGRWYEIDEQGEEHTFGLIRKVDSPDTLVIGWRLNGFGRIDPDNASEFTVTFVADGQKKTRVDVEHTHFDRMGTKHAKRVRNGMDKGWPTILQSFQNKIDEEGAKK